MKIIFKRLALLAMIAHSAILSSTRTLFTMLFCSQTSQQCLIQQSLFTNWETCSHLSTMKSP